MRMLRGPSARQWSQPLWPLSVTLSIFTVASGVAYFASGATARTVPFWLAMLMLLACLNFAVVTAFVFTFLVKAIRESRQGYTTARGLYPDLPLVDSKSGEVLLEAGARAQVYGRR